MKKHYIRLITKWVLYFLISISSSVAIVRICHIDKFVAALCSGILVGLLTMFVLTRFKYFQ